MQQTVIQIGNSQGMVIPSSVRQALGFDKGEKLEIQLTDDRNSMIVSKATTSSVASGPKTNKSISKEFKQWLADTLDEDAEVLDELAER